MSDKPLWTDARTSEAYLNWQRTAVGRVDITAFVRHIRDDYQAALDAANARIAELEGERQAWRAEALRLRDAIMQMDSGNLRQDDSTAPAAQAEWQPDARDFATVMKLAWKGWEHDEKQYDQVADMLHRIDNWIARRT